MICNIAKVKASSISSAVCYVFNQESARVLVSNTIAGLQSNTRKVTSHLRSVSELNERVKKPLYHISVRCAPEDESLFPLEWSEVSEQFLELMDLQDNPFVAVAHGEDHVHLLVSRVDYEGNCYGSSWDYYKCQEALRTIEEERGYYQVESSFEVGKSQDTPGQVHRMRREQEEFDDGLIDEPPEPSRRRLLQDAIDEGIERSCSLDGVKLFLKRQDIYTRQTPQGWSFAVGEFHFAGYQLGGNYTLNAVRDTLKEQLQRTQGVPEVAGTQESLFPKVLGEAVLPEASANVEMEISACQDLIQDEVSQQSLTERVATVVASWLNVVGGSSVEGTKHGAFWDSQTNCLTLVDKAQNSEVMVAQWDEERGVWLDRGSSLSEEKAQYFEEDVASKLLAQRQKQKAQVRARSPDISL